MVKQKDNPSSDQNESQATQQVLILFNDDINTFDFVINSLIEVCNHEPEQAEQCALVAHFKGKCRVKGGGFYELKPLCDEMSLRGLTVAIE